MKTTSFKPVIKTTKLYHHNLSEVKQIRPKVTVQTQLLQVSEGELLYEVWPVHLNRVTERLKRGDKCYICKIDEKPVHYSWVQSTGVHRIKLAGRSITVGPGEIWIYHCRTASSARGQHIYPSVLSQILQDHRQLGFRHCWIYTTTDNNASQRGIERSGFRLAIHLSALNIASYHLPLSMMLFEATRKQFELDI